MSPTVARADSPTPASVADAGPTQSPYPTRYTRGSRSDRVPGRSAALDPSGLAVQVEAGQGRRAGRNPVHQSTNRRTGRSPRLQGQAEVSLTDR